MEIKIFNKTTKIASASMLVASCLFAGAAMAKDTVKVGVVSFLTGPAAGVFGVPAKQGAQIVIDAINNGTMPAPYNTQGFAGAKMNPVFSDESGGGTKQVGLFRDFVEKQKVDAMICLLYTSDAADE